MGLTRFSSTLACAYRYGPRPASGIAQRRIRRADKGTLRGRQRGHRGRALGKVLVEATEQCRPVAIVHIPERGDHFARPGLQEWPGDTEHALASLDLAA